MRTLIGIKLSVEGIHYFPNASKVFDERIEFLEFPHRHNFGIECKFQVNHDNRDKEFILLKREVLSYLHKEFADENNVCCFGHMSCEMIAKRILQNFGFDYVKVDEDGENYAEVYKVNKQEPTVLKSGRPQDQKKESQTNKQPIIVKLIIGGCCSGKTTFAKNNIANLPYGTKSSIIEIGNIVRSIANRQERTFNKDLQCEIIEYLERAIKQLEAEDNQVYYIVGIRQLKIFKYLFNYFSLKKNETQLEVIMMRIDEEVRKKRFESSNFIKNSNLTFKDVDEAEKDLGLKDLMSYLLTNFYDSKILKIIEE